MTTDKELTYNSLQWDFHDEDTQSHLHALHPYPCRFIPQIPRKAISLWSSPGDTVLDPFCGCGTTLLEGILLQRPSIGIDNNSVAALISQAKVSCYSKRDIDVLRDFAHNLATASVSPSNMVEMQQNQHIGNWFSSEAIADLSYLKANINGLSKSLRVMALAAFSSIIVRASHQDSDTRYVHVNKQYKSGNAIKWFGSKLQETIESLSSLIEMPTAKATVFCQDGTNLQNIGSGSVSLIVTSPPYLNAYDYYKYHCHRIHWTDGDIDFTRKTEIGKHDFFSRSGAVPARYFCEMEQCFQQWEKVLCSGGYVFMVIADAVVGKQPVPVADLFIEMLTKMGYRFVYRWTRKLKVSQKSFNQATRTKSEHVLLFQKTHGSLLSGKGGGGM